MMILHGKFHLAILVPRLHGQPDGSLGPAVNGLGGGDRSGQPLVQGLPGRPEQGPTCGLMPEADRAGADLEPGGGPWSAPGEPGVSRDRPCPAPGAARRSRACRRPAYSGRPWGGPPRRHPGRSARTGGRPSTAPAGHGAGSPTVPSRRPGHPRSEERDSGLDSIMHMVLPDRETLPIINRLHGISRKSSSQNNSIYQILL